MLLCRHNCKPLGKAAEAVPPNGKFLRCFLRRSFRRFFGCDKQQEPSRHQIKSESSRGIAPAPSEWSLAAFVNLRWSELALRFHPEPSDYISTATPRIDTKLRLPPALRWHQRVQARHPKCCCFAYTVLITVFNNNYTQNMARVPSESLQPGPRSYLPQGGSHYAL